MAAGALGPLARPAEFAQPRRSREAPFPLQYVLPTHRSGRPRGGACGTDPKRQSTIMPGDLAGELLSVNQRLLDSIAEGDWSTYQELCDPTVTAFEPEALGHRVEGLAFHRFYFDLGSSQRVRRTTMCDAQVRVMGDVGVVTYVRLNQRVAPDGTPVTTGSEETRVWQRRDGKWRHVHVHRTALPSWPR